MSLNYLEGDYNFNAAELKIGLVASRFNNFIVEHLVKGALDQFKRHGVQAHNITIIMVPGAFEVGGVLKKLIDKNVYDGLIAVGAVIKGETSHYDIVSSESAKAIAALSFQSGVPIINSIITTNTIDQAVERSGTKAGNKGSEGALGLLELISLYKKIDNL